MSLVALHDPKISSAINCPRKEIRQIRQVQIRCGSLPGKLMKHLDPADTVNLFTSQAPDAVAIRIRIRRIAFMHQIVKEPAGDHHALV